MDLPEEDKDFIVASLLVKAEEDKKKNKELASKSKRR